MVCSLCSWLLYIYMSVCTQVTIPDLWINPLHRSTVACERREDNTCTLDRSEASLCLYCTVCTVSASGSAVHILYMLQSDECVYVCTDFYMCIGVACTHTCG